jgi:hypothetical protein
VKITMILCDAAQVAEGKLYIMGGGWNMTGPAPTPSALGILIEVPWDRTNAPFVLRLELREQDGPHVMQPGPLGPQPVQLQAQMEVGRPPGVAKGSSLQVPLAINIPPLVLTPGRRYSWKARINGEPENDDWHVSFQTRPA